jgi:N-acetylmuramoyl-L-alanine amidase
MRRRAPWWPLALAALATIAALSGCASVPARPPSQPGARPAPGYVKRVDELNAIDASSLSGRRIVLDPGHGGIFRGALGVDGLTEAEVNLGVAHHLRGLLEARGAIVFMTRTDDRDFLSPADSTLRFDLSERTRLANEFHPDLFVSIHHNADARGAHDVNETQTYYKLGDDGPSLDAAADVHRYLVRNLGIAKHRIMPGNYFVLRNSEAPALLTESSYLTNPDVEKKLALAAKQRLEAEALFLGLAKYFARRVPVIEEFRAYADGYPGADSSFIGGFSLRARVRGAADQISMTLDGAPVAPMIHGDRLDWSDRRGLPIGVHVATLRIGLAGEGTSSTRTLRLHVSNAPNRIVAEFPDQLLWKADQPLGLRVRILDQGGFVDRDTLRVRVRDVGTRPLSPADTVIDIVDGEGWAYFWPSTRAVKLRSARAPRLVDVVVGLHPPMLGESGKLVDDVRLTISTYAPMEAPSRTGFARGMPADTILTGVPGTTGFAPRIEWINRDGFVRLWRDSSGAVRLPRLAGYRAWPSDSIWPPRFAAIAGGALHGRRITLDPDGGGEDAAGSGPSGTRASTLNLEVARALAGYLVAAGAEVKLTREGDFSMSDVERVQVSEAFRADRFVRIGHAAEPPMLGYYFSSAGGKRMAERAAAAFASLGIAAPRLAEDAQYPLQQTSCPALYVSIARVDDASSEEALLAPGALRAEAYALFVALAREWAPDAEWPADSIEVRSADGKPVSGAAVTLGGALVVETDAFGRARFARTEAGPIEASVEDSRVHARTILLDSSRGIILTGSIGR